MTKELPRFRFSLRLLLAMPLLFFLFVACIAATTSSYTLSKELKLPDGRVLQARDTKRYNLPFTSTWLRREIEVVEVTKYSHKILYRITSEKLRPNAEFLHPHIDLIAPNKLEIRLINGEAGKPNISFVLPMKIEESS